MQIVKIYEDTVGRDVDSKLVKDIVKYTRGFANKNEQHIAFFGGHLLGVHTVRFTDMDRDDWFDQILDCDEEELASLLQEVDVLNPDGDGGGTRFVSSDPMNLSCIWLVHAIHKSTMSKVDKDTGMFHVVLMLQYKFLTSIIARWFRFAANPAVAEATYNALSNRFGLKIHGTWQKLLEYRTGEILSPKGLWQDVITKGNDDERIIRMVNHIQVSIKDIMKNITAVFYEIHADPDRYINSTKANHVDMDGELQVKDIQRHQGEYLRYIKGVILDRGSFIKPELMEIIHGMMRTVPIKQLSEVLGYMSDNYGPKLDATIEPWLESLLKHFFDVMQQTKGSERRLHNVSTVMPKMKGLYLASKSNHTILAEVKKQCEQYVVNAVRTKNGALINALRTGAMLYVVLRTFTMHHYSK